MLRGSGDGAGSERSADGLTQRRHLFRRRDDVSESELLGLRAAPVGVPDTAQLAGQPDLAEAGDRHLIAHFHAFRGAGDGESNGQIGPRLLDADAAGDVDEHVGGTGADAGVAAEDGEYEREAVAVDAVGDSAGRDDLGWRDERLDLDQERPGAFHGGEDDAARGSGWPRPETRPRRPPP